MAYWFDAEFPASPDVVGVALPFVLKPMSGAFLYGRFPAVCGSIPTLGFCMDNAWYGLCYGFVPLWLADWPA